MHQWSYITIYFQLIRSSGDLRNWLPYSEVEKSCNIRTPRPVPTMKIYFFFRPDFMLQFGKPNPCFIEVNIIAKSSREERRGICLKTFAHFNLT